MATVETAYIVRDYADYFIASQDLEPGEGWDYIWLNTHTGEVFLYGFLLVDIRQNEYYTDL